MAKYAVARGAAVIEQDEEDEENGNWHLRWRSSKCELALLRQVIVGALDRSYSSSSSNEQGGSSTSDLAQLWNTYIHGRPYWLGFLVSNTLHSSDEEGEEEEEEQLLQLRHPLESKRRRRRRKRRETKKKNTEENKPVVWWVDAAPRIQAFMQALMPAQKLIYTPWPICLFGEDGLKVGGVGTFFAHFFSRLIHGEERSYSVFAAPMMNEEEEEEEEHKLCRGSQLVVVTPHTLPFSFSGEVKQQPPPPPALVFTPETSEKRDQAEIETKLSQPFCGETEAAAVDRQEDKDFEKEQAAQDNHSLVQPEDYEFDPASIITKSRKIAASDAEVNEFLKFLSNLRECYGRRRPRPRPQKSAVTFSPAREASAEL